MTLRTGVRKLEQKVKDFHLKVEKGRKLNKAPALYVLNPLIPPSSDSGKVTIPLEQLVFLGDALKFIYTTAREAREQNRLCLEALGPQEEMGALFPPIKPPLVDPERGRAYQEWWSDGIAGERTAVIVTVKLQKACGLLNQT